MLRGLHFQVPPAEQHKLVLCLEGSALDAVVDLRRGSPAYGKYALFELSGGTPRMLCLPPGTAHGFLAREEGTVMLYRVTSEHVPELDLGIRWDSAGVPWGLEAQAPVLSARDLQWPKLQNFVSPFVFDGAKQSVFAGGAAQAGGDPCV
ncbi:MAG TPA: hypothetical protein DD727_04890 [Clostridiales bacterium]|nr:hypothetical protein [Clostridiales bacterium]